MTENQQEVVVREEDGRSFAVEGNDLSAYVGVSPEYRTYANETEKPDLGEGAEAELQQQQQDTDDENQYVVSEPELESPASGSHTNADPLNPPAVTVDEQVDTGVQATTASNENDGTAEVATQPTPDEQPADSAPAAVPAD